MVELEGALSSVLEVTAGKASLLQLAAEMMAGLKGCPCSVLEEAAESASLL